MLNSFGGSARSRPRVNLGGKRKELTKEELLRKAAYERSQREENRRRENAARQIQAQWSLWQARTRAMDSLRSEYDAARHRKRSAVLEKDELRRYLFFFNARRDLDRTLDIARYFVEGSASSVNAKDEARVPELITNLSLTYLGNKLARDSIELIIHAICIIADTYGAAALQFFDSSFYVMLASELPHRNVPPISSHADNLNHLITTPLHESAQMTEYTYYYFCRYLLSNTAWHLELADGAIDHILHFRNLSQGVLRCTLVPELRADELAMILTHFIELSSMVKEDLPMAMLDLWMGSVVATLRTIHARTKLTGTDLAQQRDRDEAEAEGALTLLPSLPMDDYSSQQISALFAPDLVQKLLQDGARSAFFQYHNALLQYLPKARDSLLMTLSLFATSQGAPYNLLEDAHAAFSSNVTHDSSYVSDAGVFYLELLSRVLITMVDDEFFDARKNPLSLASIQRTVLLLKDLAYGAFMKLDGRAIVTIQPSGCHVTGSYLQNLYARILQQIQVRDSRRTFLPKDFWLYTEKFEMKSLIHQVALEAFPDPDEEDDDDDVARRKRSQVGASPRIKILANCPFFFPFYVRIEMLQTLINMDAEKSGFRDYFSRATRHHVVCRRGHEFEDGFEALWKIGGGLKGPLSVDYRDVYGMPEAGIDGGGLTKEFLSSVCKQAFHPDFGMFVETPERLLYPNPATFTRSATYLQHYEFLGRVIAKCMYEGILVDVAFAPFFLLNWVGKLAYIDDLQAMDKDLYSGLLQLKNYTGDVENDLALDFTVNEEELGQQRTINLIPNGSEVAVTQANRLQYIQMVCHFKLNSRLARQSQAFVKGMSDVLDTRWLGMFNQNEMQALVGGAPVPIDLSDLRKNTVYGGYDEDDQTVRIFWEVLAEFSNEERRKLVKFVTSTPRPPLLGFKELQPNFSLRNAGSDVNRLPTASTCVNLLKLPAYTSHEQMRHKLRLSITAEAGFDLS